MAKVEGSGTTVVVAFTLMSSRAEYEGS